MKTDSTAATPAANDPARPNGGVPALDKATAKGLFEKVCALEDPTFTVIDHLRALYLMTAAETIEDDRDQAAFQRLIWAIQDKVKEIEELRGSLFHGLHRYVYGDVVHPVDLVAKEAAE